MQFFRTIYYLFSRYTDPAERRVGRFLARVGEHDTSQRTKQRLIDLLQGHIAVINLWTEHRYKGYRYLKKSKRRQLYRNLAAIQADFDAFATEQTVDYEQLLHHVKQRGGDTAKLRPYREQLSHLALIMRYLSPRAGRYTYRASSSFGRLLVDPQSETLEGDCNQIVTLYLSLYATKFDIRDIELTVYPGHVALHFNGVDIETTNATFTRYDKPGQATVPVQEIVSINLLDTTDSHFRQYTVAPEVFLEAARLAHVLSSNRAIVAQNLRAAYQKTVNYLAKQGDYSKALVFARQSRDVELISYVAHNGALHYMKKQQYPAARKLAAHALKKQELLQSINYSEGVYYYKAKKFHDAIRAFGRAGRQDMVQRCYEGLYFEEQAKIKGIKTVTELQSHKKTIRSMQHNAKKSGNTKLVQHANKLMKQL